MNLSSNLKLELARIVNRKHEQLEPSITTRIVLLKYRYLIDINMFTRPDTQKS